jgi:hypothetical protein
VPLHSRSSKTPKAAVAAPKPLTMHVHGEIRETFRPRKPQIRSPHSLELLLRWPMGIAPEGAYS